jgi:cytoskeletal protein CcmA (bactofilin family)
MSCPGSLDLACYAGGETPPDERSGVDDHVRQCAACRSAVDSLRSEDRRLRGALVGSPVRSPKALVTPATLLRNIGAAAALLWLPAWLISRPPALRFALPALAEQAQAPIALSAALLAFAAVALRFGLRRARGMALLLLLAAVPASASTFRTAEVVRLDGIMAGDVYAFARRVEVRGTVRGRVLAFAQEIHVLGNVEGCVGAWGETVVIAPTARIRGGLTAAGAHAEVAGEVGGSLRFYGDRLTVVDSARIAGPISARVGNPGAVRVPAGVALALEGENARFLLPSFYWRTFAAFAAALLVALLGSRLCPIAIEDSVIALTGWWRSLWMGCAIALISLAAALSLAATVIALPLAILVVAALALALFCATLVVGAFAGRLFLPSRRRAVQTLCGLAVVFIASELPFGVGGAVWGAVGLSGLGAFGEALRRRIALPKGL